MSELFHGYISDFKLFKAWTRQKKQMKKIVKPAGMFSLFTQETSIRAFSNADALKTQNTFAIKNWIQNELIYQDERSKRIMKDKFVDKTWLIAWCEQTGIYNLCLTFSIKNDNNSMYLSKAFDYLL